MPVFDTYLSKNKVARSRLYSCHLKTEPVCDRTRSEYEI